MNSTLIYSSTIHPRMASMVELQASRSLWLRYWTGGLTRADGIRQRIDCEQHLGVQGC
jgi:hypothetical protein